MAAIASIALLGALVAAPTGSVGQVQQSGAVKKGVQTKCPPRFTIGCKSGYRLVCVKRDSRGCCTKSVCQFWN
jgi:hypothetical protein